jgi:CheY-like chemotaxis protein
MKLNPNFKYATMLVVEDNNDQWQLMQQALKLALPELKFVRTSNAQQTLTWLDEQYREVFESPRLILLDLYLPRREEGLRILEEIKAKGAPFSQIPIIMFSSSDNKEDILLAYNQGVSSYTVKPVEFDEWIAFFNQIRSYWWETVRLPSVSRNLL